MKQQKDKLKNLIMSNWKNVEHNLPFKKNIIKQIYISATERITLSNSFIDIESFIGDNIRFEIEDLDTLIRSLVEMQKLRETQK